MNILLWILSVILVLGGIFGLGVFIVRVYDDIKQAKSDYRLKEANQVVAKDTKSPDVKIMSKYNDAIISGD